MKTFKCKVARDFWKFETDKWQCESPSGKRVSYYAHHPALKTEEGGRLLAILEPVLLAYAQLPVEGDYTAMNNWRRDKTMELTTEQMRAFKRLSEIAPL